MDRPTASATGGGEGLPICRYRGGLPPGDSHSPSSHPWMRATISHVSFGPGLPSGTTHPAPGGASATPIASTPSFFHAVLALVGPRSAPPCFFEPPTIVGAMARAPSAHASA